MGASVSRTDFDWADDYHTHNRRRAIILKKYPEIRKLMTYDPIFKWKVLAMVVVQMISFVLLSYVSSFWVFFVCAYFFGGVINHSLTLAIHDISHNQAYGYGRPLANRLFGMVANLPMGIPTSVTFKKYHADHHAFLGKQADTDLPTEWEGRFFNNSPRKILWLVLNPLFYAIRPMVVSPKPIEALEVLNLIVQFSFDYLIVRYLGWHVLLYMILGTLVCMGLHPIAGHFLSEHYVFFYEEDYLEKLRVHQKELSEKLLVPDTFSYYGPWNLLTYNVGYHVEHHDFPNIPSSLLPEVRRIASEFYEPLCYHTSWTRALLRYILDPRMGPFARIRRKELFVEYMNTNKAAAKSTDTVNGIDHNGNSTDLSQQHSNGVHLNGVGETRNGTNFRSRKTESTQVKLSVKESENELIKAHYTFYDEFTCGSGQCIQAYGVCNKVEDCLDGSDEMQCSHEQDFVHCDNGVSVHRSLWCDGRPEPDCPSQNDEQNCQCQANEFSCLNSRCIQKSSLCDAVCDCAGSCEDELNCTKYYNRVDGVINCFNESTIACKISEDGRTVERCLGKEYICDGVSDCPKSFDEYGCLYGGYTEENCAQHKDFWCPIEKRCLPRVARCNFIQECLLGLDEVDCERPPCDGFQCNSGQCIDNELRCDSVVHCFDKSDEMKCENFQCPSGFRSCDSGQCIREAFWCDGYFEDCLDKSDEVNCNDTIRQRQPPTKSCDAEKGLFRCESGQCIDARYRCLKSANRRLMCADGSNLHHCANWTCQSAGQIKCAGSYCVEEALRCNERLDCPVLSDWADEASCPFICSKTNRCPCVDTTINCTDQGLTAIPEGIEDQILRMILKGNYLGKNLTIDMFVRLDRMNMIDLSSNEIAYIPPKLFRKLWKLRILHLGKNRIDVIDSYTFFGMPNLVTLSLNGNKIVVIREHAFSGLASLKTLDLSNQRISSLQKNAFFGLRSLTNLVLSGNQIYELNDGMFSGLQAVISIDLLGNAISRVGSKTFLGLNSIKQITFDEFRFCCLVRHVDTCYPPPNEFSSCEDLMSNSILRICIWILGMVSIIGNTFVISWRLKYQTVNKVHSFLICHLGLSDFLMGVYLIIIASVDSYYRGIYFIVDADWRQSSLCHFAGFLSTLSSEFSVFALLVITIDRLITITFPFRIYKMRMKDAQLIIAILWLVAIVLSGLPLIRHLPFDNFYGRSGVCLALHITNERPSGWEYSVFIFLVLNLLSFTLICGSYLWMFIAARNTQIAARSAENHLQNRMARRMAFIVLTDFACFAPIFILGIVSFFDVNIPPGVFAWIAVFVLPLNSALNPVVYTMSGVTMVARKANSVVGGGGGGGTGGGASPQSLIRMSIRGQNGNGSFKTKTSYL